MTDGLSARNIIITKLKKGASNAAAVEAARKAHPRTTLTAATANSLRNRLRKEGFDIPTNKNAK